MNYQYVFHFFDNKMRNITKNWQKRSYSYDNSRVGKRNEHFALIIETNERIKELRKISRGIRLSALNALIASLRTGRSAAGFSVVSERVIDFSKELEKISIRLELLNRDLMVGSSQYSRLNKTKILVRVMFDKVNARESEIELDQLLHDIKDRDEKSGSGLLKEIKNHTRELFDQVRAIKKHTREARIAALESKLESVNAEKNAVLLAQVADGFSRSIDKLDILVKAIEKLWKAKYEEN